MFKILSTIAVGILSTAWAWQNFRFINDWFVDKTGIGVTSEERMRLRKERIAARTPVVINQPVSSVAETSVVSSPETAVTNSVSVANT